jgi:hypothetical protein
MSNSNGFNASNACGISAEAATTVNLESDDNLNTDSIGFCHSCNKQNRINIENYTCTQCNGGFIELFNYSDESQLTNSRSELLNQSRSTSSITNNSTSSNSSNESSSSLNNYILIDSAQSEPDESVLFQNF